MSAISGKILDSGLDTDIAGLIIETLVDSGYKDEEIIPGLIMAVKLLCHATILPDQALDEAIELLTTEEESEDAPID
jgi:hypothetical protein